MLSLWAFGFLRRGPPRLEMSALGGGGRGGLGGRGEEALSGSMLGWRLELGDGDIFRSRAGRCRGVWFGAFG